MPPAHVNTILDDILYGYAKLISLAPYGTLQRGFIKNLLKKLRYKDITLCCFLISIQLWTGEHTI